MAVLGMECRDKPGWLSEFAEHPPREGDPTEQEV
jgi:hypothetical protein